MAAKQEYDIHILEDGTLSIETGRIAGEVHKQADEFMAFLASLLGGSVETIHKRQGVVHEHEHDHDHAHLHEHEG
jgi:hypothetical protein